ncbi:GDSL esterase/lipase At5g45950-like isoform X1 [Magnolia sinica]|uniref:GDSL esterase/lipase At5g45950-like isoform X1 n=1 Tax=Magnolia sinica TaxID=86752 RepID=UPI0026584F9D|nr:GDSL esterase/lipase At5g45950-like isoform X1 [Magnolia sinica]
MTMVVMMMMMALLQLHGDAVDLRNIRQLAALNNITCILVFGDSTVDPGNNNHLSTRVKGNYPPYGKDFFHGIPTGRFSNGRLPTDFIAEDLGLKASIPAFLDRGLKREELLHGVSFASAACGYDELTANITKVLPISKQIEYLMHYKIHLRELVGVVKEEEIVRNAVFVVSAGTNDFVQNYFLQPIRPMQFSIAQYVDYLITCMTTDIKEMHKLGGTIFAVVGAPPMGCLPLVKTITGNTDCVESYNGVATSFNSKLKVALATLKRSLGVRMAYVDVYDILLNAIYNPVKYGFTVASKGCCGTGVIEYGDTCKDQVTCEDPTKYVYWDAVHPTERMYKLIADDALMSVVENILS